MGTSDFARSTAAPSDWPAKAAWPPFKDGPTFAVEPKARADVRGGSRFYAVNTSDDDIHVQVGAFGVDGAELRTFRVQRMKDNQVEFSISNATGAVVSGSGSYVKAGSGFEARYMINNQEFTIRGNPKDPSSVSCIGEIRFTPDEAALVTEFGSLGDSIRGLGQSQSGTKTAKLSCRSCNILLTASTLASACCSLGSSTCCFGVLVTLAAYDANCVGACPPDKTPAVGGATS